MTIDHFVRTRDELRRRLRREAGGQNTSREKVLISKTLSIIVASGAAGIGAHAYFRDLRPGGTTHPFTIEGYRDATA